MCSRPSMSLPLLMRWSVAASVFFSSTAKLLLLRGILWIFWIFQGTDVANAFKVAAARATTELAQQQLRAEERNQLRIFRATERTRRSHQRSAARGQR